MRYMILILILLLTACAQQLTSQGRMVRQIEPDWAKKCEFLGVIDGTENSGLDLADDRRGALNDIRNQVAGIGGNAFVLTQTSSNGFRTLVQGDAYRCEKI